MDYKINNYQLIKIIGSGANGLVFKAKNLINNKIIAIKILLKNLNKNNNDLLSYLNDYDNTMIIPQINLNSIDLENPTCSLHYNEMINYLTLHSYKHIVSINEILETNFAFFIIMDYYPMDLFTLIVDKKIFVNNGLLIKTIFIQLIETIIYCQSKGIYHCDIKPENILIDNNYNIYLCDFGLSTTSKTIIPNMNIGSSYYMAPERILIDYNDNTIFKTEKTEVWSLGILLINLTCNNNPWSIANHLEDLTFNCYVENNSILLNLLPISYDFYNLLIKILNINPMSRINLYDLINEIKLIKSFTKFGPLSSVPCIISSEENSTSLIKQDDDDDDSVSIESDNDSYVSPLTDFSTTLNNSDYQLIVKNNINLLNNNDINTNLNILHEKQNKNKNLTDTNNYCSLK